MTWPLPSEVVNAVLSMGLGLVLLCLLMLVGALSGEASQYLVRLLVRRKMRWVCPLSGQPVGFSQEYCMTWGCPVKTSQYSTVYAADRHEMTSSLTPRQFSHATTGQRLSSLLMTQLWWYWLGRRRLARYSGPAQKSDKYAVK